MAQGWGKVPGVDCGGTFAPACRIGSTRIVMAIAAEHNMDILQLDVQTAYLQSPVVRMMMMSLKGSSSTKPSLHDVPRNMSRFDIIFAVRQLTRAMSKPAKIHMTASHLLRYLTGSPGLSIEYTTGNFLLKGYCNASWGANPDNRRSTINSGYPFFLSGELASFKSTLQKLTAQGGYLYHEHAIVARIREIG